VREIFAIDLSVHFFIAVESATVAAMAELIEEIYGRHEEGSSESSSRPV
jgi:hypothetical protein